MYMATLDLFCALITSTSPDILEMGCGPGNITRYLLEKRPDFQMLISDMAPRMLELAKKNNPMATVQLLDARKVSEIPKLFDGIMCGFVLPYLTREEAANLIKDIATKMRPGGCLYLSTMEDDYTKSGIQRSSYGDELYMYFHEAEYLSTALQTYGYKITQLERIITTTENGTITDLILVAIKQ
jgi:2-polyprenyl-3-methyl-5-hydroxy-6-metoxy-1,4-benzoquinol methylase